MIQGKGRASAATVVLTAIASLPGAASGQPAGEADLAAVQQQIAALESRLAGQVARRADGQSELKRVELSIAAAEDAIAELAGRMAEQERRRATLAEAERTAGARLGAERDALAEQVRMSYMTGRQEVFKLLLSQENPADLGRMLTYYDYLNRARGERIATVGDELASLASLTAESRDAQRALEALSDQRSRELAELDRARGERRAFLAELESAIGESGTRIERLRAEEQRLTDLVDELATLMARLPTDSEAPFGELRGRLAWPVDGTITADFGQLREGGPLRWNGVLLEAESGTLVRAVYHGRVAFADWLPGLGLLLIIDHGDGFMSLYGHNEALLREPGDWVSPGEAIAEVGDTGGRPVASLYFEIRRDGDPQNPHDWVP